MCIDEMMVFRVFLFCVVVKCSPFWRNLLPPSSGWLDCIKWMLKWCGRGRCVDDIWYRKYKANALLTVRCDISYSMNQQDALCIVIYRTVWTDRMHCSLSICFNNYPLRVSSRLTAHHQEVLLYIYSNCYMSCIYVDWLLASSGGKLHVASCTYFSTILWYNLSVWFLKGRHWLWYKLISKNLSSHCWQEWIEYWLRNTESGTYVICGKQSEHFKPTLLLHLTKPWLLYLYAVTQVRTISWTFFCT